MFFLVRLYASDGTLDSLLNEYHQGMVRYLTSELGIREDEEVKRLLTHYYQTYYQAFYNRVLAEGGSILADAFWGELEVLAEQRGWGLKLDAAPWLETGSMALPEVKEALKALLETSRQFFSRTLNLDEYNRILEDVSSRFDEAARQNVAHFEAA
jgi:hypothetical protein